jgi:hypothetical protein
MLRNAPRAPTGEASGTSPRAPSGPQIVRPKRQQPRSARFNPWAVLGGALVAGYGLAKAIDWRGHAHPRD